MPIAIGIACGAALALVQSAVTRAFIARGRTGRRGGISLCIALKLPLSMAVLALIALYSLAALASAAGGYTLVSAVIAVHHYKKRGGA